VTRIFLSPWIGCCSIAGLTPADNSLLNDPKQGLKPGLALSHRFVLNLGLTSFHLFLLNKVGQEKSLNCYDKVKFIEEPQEWGYRYTIYYSKCSDLLEINELFLRNTNRSMSLPSHDIKFSVYN